MQARFAMAAAALAVALAASPALAVDVAGVKIDDAVKVAGADLRLNGAGVRTRAIFKVYAMGLYLGRKETTTEGVLNAPGPRRVSIVMLRDVSADDFAQAFSSGISANASPADKGKFATQLAKLTEVFQSVGNLKKGDALNFDWVPGKGAEVYHNGKSAGEPIPELAFYNAILKIWLGDKPADSSLKPMLLGGKE